jgi:hypothetical protein
METTKVVKGIPTDPDVRLLLARYGVPAEGWLIAHRELEEVLGVDRRSHRYGTVIAAWRKRLQDEHNVVLIAVPGVGYKVGTPDDRVEHGSRRIRTGQRITRRAYRVIGTTDLARASEPNRKQAERDLAVARAIIAAAQAEAKRFRAVLPGPDEE